MQSDRNYKLKNQCHWLVHTFCEYKVSLFSMQNADSEMQIHTTLLIVAALLVFFKAFKLPYQFGSPFEFRLSQKEAYILYFAQSEGCVTSCYGKIQP